MSQRRTCGWRGRLENRVRSAKVTAARIVVGTARHAPPSLLLCGFAAVVTGEDWWVLEFELDNQAVMYLAPHR
jgi:hypothetical protein